MALCPEPALAQRHCLDLAGWPHHRIRSARTGPGRPGRARPSAWRRCMAATATATAMARARAWSPPPATEGDRRSAPRRTATAWPACQPAWSGQGELLGAGAAERAWDWDRKTTCAVRGTAACMRHGGRSHPSTRRCALVLSLWFSGSPAQRPIPPTHPLALSVCGAASIASFVVAGRLCLSLVRIGCVCDPQRTGPKLGRSYSYYQHCCLAPPVSPCAASASDGSHGTAAAMLIAGGLMATRAHARTTYVLYLGLAP